MNPESHAEPIPKPIVASGFKIGPRGELAWTRTPCYSSNSMRWSMRSMAFFSGRFRGSLLSCVRALSGGVNDYGCVMLVHRHRLPPVSRSRLRLPPAHPVAGANVRLRPPRSPLAPSRLPLQPAVPLQPQAHRVLRMSPPQTRRKRRLAAEHGMASSASPAAGFSAFWWSLSRDQASSR